MTEELTYRELVAKLGESLVERHLASATTGVRSDCWRCGCLRIVRARASEADIEFVPCAEHKREFEGRVIL